MSGKNERGFTLLEVMIAATLFVIGVLGVVGMRVAAINANRSAGRMAQATYLAQEQAEMLLAQDFDSSTLTDSNTGNNPTGPSADFTTIPDTTVSPTSLVDGYDANQITLDGTTSTDAFGTGTGYQRMWQIADQDLNSSIAGNDAKKIKVTVRYRDATNSARYHGVSVSVVKAKVF